MTGPAPSLCGGLRGKGHRFLFRTGEKSLNIFSISEIYCNFAPELDKLYKV